MAGQTMEERLYEELEPIVAGYGLVLVDLRAQIVREVLHVQVVIHAAAGVGIDDCAEVHRMAAPRLEALYPDRDLHIEVGSPGIDRTIRLPREYRIFQSKGVRVYSREKQQWIAGIIHGSDEGGVTIVRAGEQQRVPFADIQKARLDDSQEV
ncbi:MAG: ribosome assembly cofactor RimP [Spirochaetaceae bacterium]|nr:MAG: ribosome assembly cofactor RimP [Spirochaetaceae bacterium]